MPLQTFQIMNVPDDAADLTEQLGTKPKFWFQGNKYLFKEGNPNTGNDWAEKLASELCTLLGLPHAVYDLAVWRGKRGVVCPNFVSEGGRLEHGNELLAKILPGYPQAEYRNVRQHTLERVLSIVQDERINVPLEWNNPPEIISAVEVFIGYLMLDAWITNPDRHHENWALVISPKGTIHLAPSYDHASSLGSNETDKNRGDRLTTRDRGRSIERYVERARSAFFVLPAHSRPMAILDAFRQAGNVKPLAARVWLESRGVGYSRPHEALLPRAYGSNLFETSPGKTFKG